MSNPTKPRGVTITVTLEAHYMLKLVGVARRADLTVETLAATILRKDLLNRPAAIATTDVATEPIEIAARVLDVARQAAAEKAADRDLIDPDVVGELLVLDPAVVSELADAALAAAVPELIRGVW